MLTFLCPSQLCTPKIRIADLPPLFSISFYIIRGLLNIIGAPGLALAEWEEASVLT